MLLIVSAVCWAAGIVTGRAAAELIPPAAFAWTRWVGTLILVLPLALNHLPRDGAALWGARWRLVVMGLLGTGLYHVLNYTGLHRTTAVNAVLMQSATPLVVLLVAFLLYRQRPAAPQVAAILLSLAGVLVIAAQGSLASLLAVRLNRGDLTVLAAVSCYSVYVAMLPRRPDVHPFSFLAATAGVGAVALAPLAAAEYWMGARMVASGPAFAATLFTIVFPGFVAYLAFNRGTELVGPALAGQSMHLIPVAGIALAVTWLHERVHPYHLVGVALIAAGLVLASAARRPKA